MAESGGFEPPIELLAYNGLANRRLQPLGQLSAPSLHSLTSGCRDYNLRVLRMRPVVAVDLCLPLSEHPKEVEWRVGSTAP